MLNFLYLNYEANMFRLLEILKRRVRLLRFLVRGSVTLNNRTYLLSALSFDLLTLRASD